MSITDVQDQSISFGSLATTAADHVTSDRSGDGEIPLAVVCEIPVTSIVASPYQPRDLFDGDELARLALSMLRHGQQVPIQVRPHPAEIGLYELVDGERRLRAAQINNATTIKALIEDTSDVDVRVRSLITSLMKVNLNAMEQAKGFQDLVDTFGWTQDRIGEEFGMDQATVNGVLHLLRVPLIVQAFVRGDQLSPSHVDALRGFSVDETVELAQTAVDNGWSVKALREQVRQRKADRDAANAPATLVEASQEPATFVEPGPSTTAAEQVEASAVEPSVDELAMRVRAIRGGMDLDDREPMRRWMVERYGDDLIENRNRAELMEIIAEYGPNSVQVDEALVDGTGVVATAEATVEPVDRIEREVIGERPAQAHGANDAPKASTPATSVYGAAVTGRLTASREWLEAAAELYVGDKFPGDVGAWVSIEAAELDGELFCIVGVERLVGVHAVKAYRLTEAPADAEPSIKGRVPGQAYTGCTATLKGVRYILGQMVEIVRATDETDWPEDVAPVAVSSPAPVESGMSDAVTALDGKHFALSVRMTPANHEWLLASGLTVDEVIDMARKSTSSDVTYSKRMISALNAIIIEDHDRGALLTDDLEVAKTYSYDTTDPGQMAEIIVVGRARKLGLVFEEGG